ncbi:hypothetical protein ABZ769_11385 [Streptomyces olivoreticuli]
MSSHVNVPRELLKAAVASRWGLLDVFLALGEVERNQRIEAKQRLIHVLRSIDEFANSTAHEEYVPAADDTER